MGHDISNIIQVIMSSLELIQDDKGLPEEQRKLIEMALTSAEGGNSIIKNVESIKRMSEDVPLETVDIDAMMSECIKEAPRPYDKIVNINYSSHRGTFVKGMPLLKEIFCNLINNSIKYSGKEVDIDIDISEAAIGDARYHRIVISDNGYGIPDDVKPRLFGKFQRGTTKVSGKGLGLYIVKTLAERVGGSVRMEDRVPGDYAKGSRFTVMIPAAVLELVMDVDVQIAAFFDHVHKRTMPDPSELEIRGRVTNLQATDAHLIEPGRQFGLDQRQALLSASGKSPRAAVSMKGIAPADHACGLQATGYFIGLPCFSLGNPRRARAADIGNSSRRPRTYRSKAAWIPS